MHSHDSLFYANVHKMFIYLLPMPKKYRQSQTIKWLGNSIRSSNWLPIFYREYIIYREYRYPKRSVDRSLRSAERWTGSQGPTVLAATAADSPAIAEGPMPPDGCIQPWHQECPLGKK